MLIIFHAQGPRKLSARCNKGDVSQEQPLGILSILQRLAYPDSEDSYMTMYNELVGLGIKKLHTSTTTGTPIREEWLQGMNHNKFQHAQQCQQPSRKPEQTPEISDHKIRQEWVQ